MLTPDQRRAVERDRILRARTFMWPALPIWVLYGIGTLNGRAGRPQDAPHLHVSQDWRGWAWIASALIALVMLVALRHSDRERSTRFAAAALLFMPMVRAVSYTWAYGLWLADIDGAAQKPWLEGDSGGYYTSLPWITISWAILSQAVNWQHVGRRICARFGRRCA